MSNEEISVIEDEMRRMDKQIGEFRDRVIKGDQEALAQIEDVMSV